MFRLIVLIMNFVVFFFFLMIRRPPRSTQSSSSAASYVYKGQGDAHAHADIGGLDGGGIVDAVAGHGGDGTPILPRRNNADLVLRLDTGIDAVSGDGLGQVFVRQAIELTAGNSLIGAFQNIQLLGDGYGGVLMVTGNHNRRNAGGLTFDNRVLDLGANRVNHAGQTDENQVIFERFGREVRRGGVVFSHRNGKHDRYGLP